MALGSRDLRTMHQDELHFGFEPRQHGHGCCFGDGLLRFRSALVRSRIRGFAVSGNEQSAWHIQWRIQFLPFQPLSRRGNE